MDAQDGRREDVLKMDVQHITLFLLPLFAAAVAVKFTINRSANQVLNDLSLNGDDKLNSERETRSLRGYTFGDDLAKAGLFSADERRRYLIVTRTAPFLLTSLIFLLVIIFSKPPTPGLVMLLLSTLAFGFLLTKASLRRRICRYEMQLAFFLPLVMERIVMAVEAGLDVLPAMNVVLTQSEKQSKKIDPVSRLLKIAHRLAEAGVGFERALEEIGKKIESRPVRHAFLHLALAQKEGGELLMPLRELSDATQTYFQESIEERIAKLPARATLPLLCTFTGLLICFLIPPLLQVVSIMEKSIPK